MCYDGPPSSTDYIFSPKLYRSSLHLMSIPWLSYDRSWNISWPLWVHYILWRFDDHFHDHFIAYSRSIPLSITFHACLLTIAPTMSHFMTTWRAFDERLSHQFHDLISMRMVSWLDSRCWNIDCSSRIERGDDYKINIEYSTGTEVSKVVERIRALPPRRNLN